MNELKTTGVWHDGHSITERRSQDVEPELDHCKSLRAVGAVGSSEFRHAARIPFGLIEKYVADKGISFHEFQANPIHIKAMLNDPALSGFRIWQGRV